MKVCVISSSVFAVPLGGYGGLEAIAWHTAKGLAERGHQVALVAPDGSTCPGVELIYTGAPGQWDEKAGYGGFHEPVPGSDQKRYRDGYWKRLKEFDVLIDSSWAKWSYCLKQEGVLKAPVLGVMHAPVNTMYQMLPPGIDKPCIVCISNDQRNHFEALFNHPARTCYNGIDLDYYKPTGAPRSKRFLFLARFSSVKSPDVCMEICRQAGVSCDLVGDTSITNEPQLLEHCKRLADGKQLRIIGPCNRGETVNWYSQAYGFLHYNNRFREPFGLAPVEAMACGLPVCCWDNGAMRETVVHGETGFLVRSVPEAVEVLQLGAVGCIDRKRCREQAAQFSVQNMAKRYEALCEEALNTGGW